MQSVPITADVASSNLDQNEVYNIMLKFVSDLRQVGGFLRVIRFPPPIKLTAAIHFVYKWNIVESGVKHHKKNINYFFFSITGIDVFNLWHKRHDIHSKYNMKRAPPEKLTKPVSIVTTRQFPLHPREWPSSYD